MRPRDTFTLIIRNPLEVPVQSIRNYISGSGTFRVSEVAEAQQAINVIFRHGPCGTLYPTRTSFFQIPPAAGQSLVLSSNFLKLIRTSVRYPTHAESSKAADKRSTRRGLLCVSCPPRRVPCPDSDALLAATYWTGQSAPASVACSSPWIRPRPRSWLKARFPTSSPDTCRRRKAGARTSLLCPRQRTSRSTGLSRSWRSPSAAVPTCRR